jgi:hypothetical protein
MKSIFVVRYMIVGGSVPEDAHQEVRYPAGGPDSGVLELGLGDLGLRPSEQQRNATLMGNQTSAKQQRHKGQWAAAASLKA